MVIEKIVINVWLFSRAHCFVSQIVWISNWPVHRWFRAVTLNPKMVEVWTWDESWNLNCFNNYQNDNDNSNASGLLWVYNFICTLTNISKDSPTLFCYQHRQYTAVINISDFANSKLGRELGLKKAGFSYPFFGHYYTLSYIIFSKNSANFRPYFACFPAFKGHGRLSDFAVTVWSTRNW